MDEVVFVDVEFVGCSCRREQLGCCCGKETRAIRVRMAGQMSRCLSLPRHEHVRCRCHGRPDNPHRGQGQG